MNENEIMTNEEVIDETNLDENNQMGVCSGIAIGVLLTVTAITAVKKVPGLVSKLKNRKAKKHEAVNDNDKSCDVEVVE